MDPHGHLVIEGLAVDWTAGIVGSVVMLAILGSIALRLGQHRRGAQEGISG
jgi:hypothetical protein